MSNQDQEVMGVAGDQLRSFVERIENLEAQKSEVSEQIKELYSEAKGEGFDPKIMKRVIGMRKMKKNELIEQEELLEIYRQALGV